MPDLRRFLAAMRAATRAETEEEEVWLLSFFRFALFFFLLSMSSPFAMETQKRRERNHKTEREKPENLERESEQRERAESSASTEVGGFMPYVWFGRLLFEMIVEGF